jgi:hypothetical protein
MINHTGVLFLFTQYFKFCETPTPKAKLSGTILRSVVITVVDDPMVSPEYQL